MVENSVGTYRLVTAQFFSLEDVNRSIEKLLEELNSRPWGKKDAHSQAIKISSTPRFFSSVKTDKQNLALHCFASHSPNSSLFLDKLIPNARQV